MTQLRFGTVLAVALANIIALAAHAGVSVGSTFTYQGELRDGGELVNDTLPMTFRLFDLPSGGVQIGGNFAIGAVPVVDGRFTVLLDFGPQFNTAAARFLEIEVDGVVLSPRQQVTAAPVSLFSQNTRGINVDSQSDVSIGTTVGTEKFQVYTDDRARAIYALNLNQSVGGAKYGLYANAVAEDGYGVYGRHQATTGTRPGVYGTTDSASGNAVGVHGVVDTANAGSFSAGVRGENEGVGTNGIGVWGSQNGQGWGVYGSVAGGGNGARGVYGHSEGGGFGGYFDNVNGIGLGVDGAENNGTTAALVVQNTGGGSMLIDGNEIDTTGGALFLNQNNSFDVILADGGGDVVLLNSDTTLDVFGDVNVGQEVRAEEVIAGYHFGTLTFTSQCQSDIGTFVTHLRMEAPFLVGSITSLNGNVSYNAFTGSHYATVSETMEAGVLVRMTGVNKALMDDRPSEPVYGVVATYQANDPTCLGAYVALHDEVVTASGAPVHLIAAVGNGFLAVVDDGRGAIEPGDLLISSDVPGCAMKDDPSRFETSYVVARAAERVDWAQVEAGADGVKRRAISVLFDPMVRSGIATDAALRAQVAKQQSLIEDLQRRLNALEGK